MDLIFYPIRLVWHLSVLLFSFLMVGAVVVIGLLLIVFLFRFFIVLMVGGLFLMAMAGFFKSFK